MQSAGARQICALRAQLKHSWLENQVCNKSADDAVALWRCGSWPALDNEFPVRVKQLHQLARDLVDALSPAALADSSSVMRGLPGDVCAQIKRAVHVYYLRNTNVEALSRDITGACGELRDELLGLQQAWGTTRDCSAETQLRESWEAFLHTGRRIVELLSHVPTGTVLP